MRIFIPTRGRINAQPTYDALREHGVVLVCPPDEFDAHRLRYRKVLATPPNIQGIAATRQWIMELPGDPHIVMMDDDLKFAVRRGDDPTKFEGMPSRWGSVQHMLAELEMLFKRYSHVSISPREGANRDATPVLENRRALRVLGYNADVFREIGGSFQAGGPVMEDFEVALQFLTSGHASGILNSYVQDQGMSGAAGGCSTYRTLGVQEDGALTLARRWPAFVKTVQKTTKTAWGGATRTDVIVQWKKAYEYGRKKHA
ncbi:MAG: hypothetical protein ABL993_01005 [Vicinamibacterales bacterium]